MQLEPGVTLAQYEIRSLLGRGGMGEVYLASDLKLGRDVAIKLLPDEFTGDPQRLARFDREARVLASLDHQHIASIYGLEETDGHRFLVMQVAEGIDLAHRLRQGPLPIEDAIEVARQVAEGLEVAHERGIIHRDLKPANVVIDDENHVKILDFGLAKALDSDESDEQITNSPTMVRAATHDGVILGTAAYMSPEQARGKAVDRRADVWAFGVLLWEMITGRGLFKGDTVSDTLAAVLREEIDWNQLPPDTPPRVRRVLRMCLERNPRNRLHDIADARLILDGTFDAAAVGTSTGHAPSRLRPWMFAIFGSTLGVAATAAVFMFTENATAPSGDLAVPSISLQRLTELPGAELHPSLSPNGRMLVYTSEVSGNLELYLLRVGGDRAIPLTNHPADDSQATFSPDGESIAFRSERDGGGLFVMGATGESVRRVTSNGFDPAWSPDGTHLAFATEPVRDPYSRSGRSVLWTVDVRSGTTRQLTTTDAIQPSWSPDGKWIAYWTNDKGQRDIRIVSAEGGEPIVVTRDVPTDWSPRWAPAGGWLYFSSDRGGSMNLWRVVIDAASGAPTSEPQMLTNGVDGLALPSFSEDGSRFAVMAYERHFEQMLYSIDPGDPTHAVLEQTLQNPSASLCVPSPDGSILACRTDGVPEDLVLVRSDGSEIRRLTSDLAKDRNAGWDPAGDQLVFTSTLDGPWETWLMRADGSGRRKLTTGSAKYGTWSPDGRHYVANDLTLAGSDIGLLDVATGEFTEIPNDLELAPGNKLIPISVTPHGNHLVAIESNAAGEAIALWILDLDDGSVQPVDVVPTGEGYEAGGYWLPDGRNLLVRTDEGVTVIDTESGRRHVLVQADPGDNVVLSYDGTTLLIERGILNADIWLIALEAEPTK